MRTFEQYENIAQLFRHSLYELHTKRINFEKENSEYIPTSKFGQNWYTWKMNKIEALSLQYDERHKRDYLKNWNEGNFTECDRVLKLLEIE